MATRTYNAIGLGWATWIEDGDGSVILTSKKNDQPHACCVDADEAEDVFHVTRGEPIDNLPADGNTRSFSQSFSPEMLKHLKADSKAFYAEQFAAAAETTPIDAAAVAGTAAPKRARKK